MPHAALHDLLLPETAFAAETPTEHLSVVNRPDGRFHVMYVWHGTAVLSAVLGERVLRWMIRDAVNPATLTPVQLYALRDAGHDDRAWSAVVRDPGIPRLLPTTHLEAWGEFRERCGAPLAR